MRLVLRRAVLALLLLGLAAAPSLAQSRVERGRYLVEVIAACGNCHTPKGPNGPLPGMNLAGNFVVEDNSDFRAVAPNITPDRATGIGAWTDAQLMRAIREGIRPDGSLIGPPMPFEFYRGLADEDLAAMVAYLRTVRPVANASEKSTYRMPLPPSYGPPVQRVTAPPRSDRVAYGAYLAGPVAHCMECHTPFGATPGHRDMARAGVGGQAFNGPWGVSVASNITPARHTGLGLWTDAEIERAIRRGISRDGRQLFPPMGFAHYAAISPADMAALIAYLRSLPAIER
ncbi:cytochrome c [Siccirubricoccus sp. KC 17139]|uniref:Cytochrome c n=1 Tax=Siccirubricoccus soli TaxID=2899147 RepID=A0ABT1D6C6_9PROT|nr:cytochrome c [Siccirubricoccus soli]MCO6417483.1 cytochrome c [Siccirubricoccus soli]MCP2683618.1 cytochrome c [Siccirubricoccus soli]